MPGVPESQYLSFKDRLKSDGAYSTSLGMLGAENRTGSVNAYLCGRMEKRDVLTVIMRLDTEALTLYFMSMLHKSSRAFGVLTRCNGQTQALFTILTVRIPAPVMARYSSGVATL